MKIIFRLALFIVLNCLLVVTGVTYAQSDLIKKDSSLVTSLSNPGRNPWESIYVQRQADPVWDVGRYVSLALRPFDDSPVIAYYDYTNGDLMVAIPVGADNGNCGTDNAWSCNPVDGASSNVGSYTSMDIWGDSADLWKLGISYRSGTDDRIKVYILTCVQGTCTPTYSTLDFSLYGARSSFKFKSNGDAALVYFTTRLYYAYQTSKTEIKFDALEPTISWSDGPIFSYFPSFNDSFSLDFNYEDEPFISYHMWDTDEGGKYFGYAIPYQDPYHFCDPDTNWNCYKVTTFEDAGQYASIAAPKSENDPVRIAYIEETYNHLYYYESGWGSFMVDELGESIASRGISLQIDNDGYPVIAYQKIESDFSPPALWIARPYMVYDDGAFGNCGSIPPGMTDLYWRCTPLDTGNQYVSEAEYLSLVVNSKGLLAIAYSEMDEYDYYMSVKYIYQYFYKNLLPLTMK